MLGKEGCARSDLLDFRVFLCTGSVDSSSLSFVWSGTQCPVTEQTVVQWTSGGPSRTRLQCESFPNKFLFRWTRQAWRLCLWLSRTPFLGWLSNPFFPCSKRELVKGEGNEQGGYRSNPISGKAVQNSKILGLHLKQLETSLHVAVVQQALGKIVKWYNVVIFVAYWFFFSSLKHHCRKCGQAVCGKCSTKRSSYPIMGFEFQVRVCDSCFESIKDEEWVLRSNK